MDEKTIAMMTSHQWSLHCGIEDNDVKEEGIINNLLRTISLVEKYNIKEDDDLFIDACCIDREAASKI